MQEVTEIALGLVANAVPNWTRVDIKKGHMAIFILDVAVQ
jgi:hypothetical protein